MTVCLDDIRRHVEEQRVSVTSGFLGRTVARLKEETGRSPYVHLIKEVIPSKGRIVLSGSRTKIIMYDVASQTFEEADYNIDEGQPQSRTGYPLAFERIVPASALEVAYFSGHQPQSELYRWNETMRKNQAAGFLESLLEISNDVPVLEIGKNEGDSFNRFFPFRKYRIIS